MIQFSRHLIFFCSNAKSGALHFFGLAADCAMEASQNSCTGCTPITLTSTRKQTNTSKININQPHIVKYFYQLVHDTLSKIIKPSPALICINYCTMRILHAASGRITRRNPRHPSAHDHPKNYPTARAKMCTHSLCSPPNALHMWFVVFRTSANCPNLLRFDAFCMRSAFDFLLPAGAGATCMFAKVHTRECECKRTHRKGYAVCGCVRHAWHECRLVQRNL